MDLTALAVVREERTGRKCGGQELMEKAEINPGLIVRMSFSLRDAGGSLLEPFSSWSLLLTKALQHHSCSRTQLSLVTRQVTCVCLEMPVDG